MVIVFVLLAIIGIGVMIAIALTVITLIGMFITAVCVSVYRVFRYRTWTAAGRERVKHL